MPRAQIQYNRTASQLLRWPVVSVWPERVATALVTAGDNAPTVQFRNTAGTAIGSAVALSWDSTRRELYLLAAFAAADYPVGRGYCADLTYKIDHATEPVQTPRCLFDVVTRPVVPTLTVAELQAECPPLAWNQSTDGAAELAAFMASAWTDLLDACESRLGSSPADIIDSAALRRPHKYLTVAKACSALAINPRDDIGRYWREQYDQSLREIFSKLPTDDDNDGLPESAPVGPVRLGLG